MRNLAIYDFIRLDAMQGAGPHCFPILTTPCADELRGPLETLADTRICHARYAHRQALGCLSFGFPNAPHGWPPLAGVSCGNESLDDRPGLAPERSRELRNDRLIGRP